MDGFQNLTSIDVAEAAVENARAAYAEKMPQASWQVMDARVGRSLG